MFHVNDPLGQLLCYSSGKLDRFCFSYGSDEDDPGLILEVREKMDSVAWGKCYKTFYGATTLSIATFSIKTLSIKTLSIIVNETRHSA
jgi:hypothetical protein